MSGIDDSLGEDWATPTRWAREILGLTQSQLAERAGVSTQQVSSWERGIATPRLPETRMRLREIYAEAQRRADEPEVPVSWHRPAAKKADEDVA